MNVERDIERKLELIDRVCPDLTRAMWSADYAD